VPPQPNGPKIIRFSINPSDLIAGQSSSFTVILDKPAPPGTVVIFDSVTNTGLTDTIINLPVSLTFNQSQTQASLIVQTHHITDEVTDILFTVHNGISQKSAELRIK